MNQLKEYYDSTVRKNLKEEFDFKNIFEIPKLEKIVVNVGAGEAVQNHNALGFIQNDLTLITGQKPSVRKAKKSIAGFKLREGMPIGVMVTLRSRNMYDFLFRFINIAIPRIRDFKGVSPKAFDNSGNLTFGIREQLIFPEINFDKTDKVRGLSVTFVTSTNKTEHSRALLKNLGIPFRKN